MSISVKLGQLVAETVDGKFLVLEALSSLLKTKMTLPAKFTLSEIIEEVDAKTKNFREQHVSLLKENGFEIKDDKGNITGYQAYPEKVEFVKEELKKLVNLDVELPGNKFNLDDFKHVDSEDDSIHWVKWLFEKAAKEVSGEVL